MNRLVLLSAVAVLVGGCQHRTNSRPASSRSAQLIVSLKVLDTPNASLPLQLVVRDSRERRAGEAPLSNNAQGWSFRLRPGAYRVVVVGGCLRRVQLGARTHLRLVVVLRSSGCRIRGGAPRYAGLTPAEALRVAVRKVVRLDYRGDAPLFYRNLGERQMRRTRDGAGHRAWLVRFYDAQALRSSCAYAWRGPELWARVHLVPCAETPLGAA